MYKDISRQQRIKDASFKGNKGISYNQLNERDQENAFRRLLLQTLMEYPNYATSQIDLSENWI